MGFFSSLDVEQYDRQYSDRQLLKRMLNYFRPKWQLILGISAMLLIMSVTGALSPVIVSRGVDLLGETSATLQLAGVIAAIFAVGIINWTANWVRRRLTVRAVGDIEVQLRTDTFKAALGHDLSFFDKIASGRIVSRITSDTRDFVQVVVMITDLISQVIQAVILGVILISIDPRLALITFAYLPVIFLFAIGYRNWARTVTRQGMRAMANVNSTIKETVSGIAIAKNFRQEASIYDEFDRANQQSYRVNLVRGFVLALMFPVLNIIGGIGVAILVYFGGMSAANGVISAGAWFLFLQSLDRFFFPILNLSAFWAQVQNGLSAAERVFALIDAEPAVVQNDHRHVPALKGEICFKNVGFQYTDNEQVLADFNLHIHPGETVALVGHTGAGKSSIAKLIARFYEYQQGQIYIDGMDIRSFDLREYRRQLGIVSQTPFLFSGTVLENICYACSSAPPISEILSLANQIGEGEWLDSLPQGLETEVGERGVRLSMGQRQLVCLMRVLVQRPAIFVLDEATASIDPFTEWQIQQALHLILEKTTSILIAHRLSTVKAADRIIVIDKGVIIEEGDHEALLSKGGHYATLYNTYFRHQSLEYIEHSRDLTKQ